MKAVVQRVFEAKVTADGVFSGKCGRGLYILLGVMKGDAAEDAVLLAEKISKLRIFSDDCGKMNLSIKDIDGEALVVSNFTLAANYAHGNRPDYFNGAAPDEANRLYEKFISELKSRVRSCESGVFGSDMKTEMVTDGPVTIVMDSNDLKKRAT